MTDKPENPPAFPFAFEGGGTMRPEYHPGMELRDYFAAAALQGMCASIPADKWANRTNGVPGFKYMSQVAYDAADAMLAARREAVETHAAVMESVAKNPPSLVGIIPDCEAPPAADLEPDGMVAYMRAIANPDRNDPNWPLPSFDARDWAKSFCEKFPGHDEALMVAWFANALMRGFDEHAKCHAAAIEALRAERDQMEARWKLDAMSKARIAADRDVWQARVKALEGALNEAVEFASQDCQALTPVGEAMVNRWKAIAAGGADA